MGTEPVDYCREIEAHLCRKNEGHLIRVVGPSFDLVSGWAAAGIPLKVAFRGIDRCVERYHRKGPRRRPVRIDFCDADVQDVFDEWRRAIGLPSGSGVATVARDEGTGQAPLAPAAVVQDPAESRRSATLAAHLERALTRLSTARAGGRLADSSDAILDRLSQELDRARTGRGLRGTARQVLIERLQVLDRELVDMAAAALDDGARAALAGEADEELAPYRGRMGADAYTRAHRAVLDRLVRERFSLPTLVY